MNRRGFLGAIGAAAALGGTAIPATAREDKPEPRIVIPERYADRLPAGWRIVERHRVATRGLTYIIVTGPGLPEWKPGMEMVSACCPRAVTWEMREIYSFNFTGSFSEYHDHDCRWITGRWQ